MSITRKFLKGMGLTDEQQDTILEAHTETVDEIKAERDRLKSEAENLPKLQKQLEQAQADLAAAQQDGWKDKHDTLQKEHNALKKEFESYKSGVTIKEAKAAKEAAARAYYQEKGITGKSLDIAMRGSGAEIDALELDEVGKIKDAKALDELIGGTLAPLVSTVETHGAETHNPPVNGGGGTMTKEQIMNIKDAGERQRAIAENPALFGI